MAAGVAEEGRLRLPLLNKRQVAEDDSTGEEDEGRAGETNTPQRKPGRLDSIWSILSKNTTAGKRPAFARRRLGRAAADPRDPELMKTGSACERGGATGPGPVPE